MLLSYWNTPRLLIFFYFQAKNTIDGERARGRARERDRQSRWVREGGREGKKKTDRERKRWRERDGWAAKRETENAMDREREG